MSLVHLIISRTPHVIPTKNQKSLKKPIKPYMIRFPITSLLCFSSCTFCFSQFPCWMLLPLPITLFLQVIRSLLKYIFLAKAYLPILFKMQTISSGIDMVYSTFLLYSSTYLLNFSALLFYISFITIYNIIYLFIFCLFPKNLSFRRANDLYVLITVLSQHKNIA